MGKPQTTELSAAKIAFETRFPRLRLVTFRPNQAYTEAQISVAGPGPDLIDIGLLAQCTIDAMPRCGVKHVGQHEGAGIYSAVHRTGDGFRVQLWVDNDNLFGAFRALREALALKAPPEFEGGASFSAVFPGLRIIREPWLDSGGTLHVRIAGEASDGFVRAGFATQTIFDAASGDTWSQFLDESDQRSVSNLERLPAMQGYRLDIDIGRDAQGPAATVRKLFVKTRDQMSSFEIAENTIAMCGNVTCKFPPTVAAQLNRHIAEMLAIVRQERDRPERAARSVLRLVVDNEALP